MSYESILFGQPWSGYCQFLNKCLGKKSTKVLCVCFNWHNFKYWNKRKSGSVKTALKCWSDGRNLLLSKMPFCNASPPSWVMWKSDEYIGIYQTSTCTTPSGLGSKLFASKFSLPRDVHRHRAKGTDWPGTTHVNHFSLGKSGRMQVLLHPLGSLACAKPQTHQEILQGDDSQQKPKLCQGLY